MRPSSPTVARRGVPTPADPTSAFDVDPTEPPPVSGGTEWRDLACAAAIAVTSLLLADAPTFVRLPIGLIAVLFAPGYALTSLLITPDEQVDRIEQVGLSLGLSLAMIATGAFFLDRLSGGLVPGSIRGLVVGSTLVLVFAAAIRRRRRQAITPPLSSAPLRRRISRAVRFTQAILVANVLVAVLAYTIALGSPTATPTAFYLLSPDGQIGDYPTRIGVGEEIPLRVGVEQTDASSGQYVIEIRQGEKVLGSHRTGRIEPGITWESTLQLRPKVVGPDQEFTIVLNGEGAETPFRTLRLFIDVVDDTGA